MSGVKKNWRRARSWLWSSVRIWVFLRCTRYPWWSQLKLEKRIMIWTRQLIRPRTMVSVLELIHVDGDFGVERWWPSLLAERSGSATIFFFNFFGRGAGTLSSSKCLYLPIMKVLQAGFDVWTASDRPVKRKRPLRSQSCCNRRRRVVGGSTVRDRVSLPMVGLTRATQNY